MRVLLVEDEPDIRFITRLSLEETGHEVTAVNDGYAALSVAATGSFDVVLLDVMMPHMDGFVTCKQLKANPATSGLPVIFLTAKSQETEVQEGLALGALGYIVKPFDVFQLSQQIEALLGAGE